MENGLLIKRKHESNAHMLLKQKAMTELIEQGYTVHSEYHFQLPMKLFIIDVVGFKGNQSVAIECGKVCSSKLELLKKHFSKVIRYHYNASINAKRESKIIASLTELSMGIIRKISSNGRIQVPPEVLNRLQLKDGDSAYWIEDREGKIVLRKA